jgi:hypothetical protein
MAAQEVEWSAPGGVPGPPPIKRVERAPSGVGRWGPTSEAREAGCKGTPPINK